MGVRLPRRLKIPTARQKIEPKKPSAAGRFSHRPLDAAGLRPAGDEQVRSVLWRRRRSSFIMTDRRLLFAERAGRRATAHWAALGDVRNAGVTRAGRDHRFMAAAASLALGTGFAFLFSALGLAPGLLLTVGLGIL